MINLAICDDNIDQLELISHYVEEFSVYNNYKIEVSKFAHPDALIRVSANKHFHMYILDIIMPMMNGIKMGQRIRSMDREAQIFYVSTSPDFSLASFSSQPINYLLKPVSKRQIFDTLELALSRITAENKVVIPIKTKEGLSVIPIETIICCQRIGFSIQFTLQSGKIVQSLSIRCSLSNYLETMITDKRFLQPHTSYILNMDYVEEIRKESFILKSGIVVPISQKRYCKVYETYLDYVFRK